MKNQLKILSFILKLKTSLKKEDNVTFDEKSMTYVTIRVQQRGNLGKIYLCRQMDNFETKK